MPKKQTPISLLKGFLSVSGLILLLGLTWSCAVTGRRGAVVIGQPAPWFTSDTGHFLFNTRIGLMKNHFSGLTVIRQDSTGHYRMAMITEVGIKLLDMELVAGSSTSNVYYVMDALDRRSLLRTLSSDLNLMLMNHGRDMRPGRLTYRNESRMIRFQNGCRKYDYSLYPESAYPQSAVYLSGIRRKVKVDYFGHPGSWIDSVKISHTGLKLTIDLYRIP